MYNQTKGVDEEIAALVEVGWSRHTLLKFCMHEETLSHIRKFTSVFFP